MTDTEFNRYQKAVDIKNKIDKLENDIEYLDIDFNRDHYPRSESNWSLNVILNDIPRTISLTSDLFWECLELVKNRKLEELNNLNKKFEIL